MRSDDLRIMGVEGLLSTYASILHLLRHRGIVRSFNNPIADVTEWLVSTTLDLKLATGSSKGFDAEDMQGLKYQIKARWRATSRSSRNLSALRELETKPFDYLIAVIFDSEFQVDYAAQIPISFILENSKYNERTNSYRFNFTRNKLSAPGVLNLTETLSIFPPSTAMERWVTAANRTVHC